MPLTLSDRAGQVRLPEGQLSSVALGKKREPLFSGLDRIFSGAATQKKRGKREALNT